MDTVYYCEICGEPYPACACWRAEHGMVVIPRDLFDRLVRFVQIVQGHHETRDKLLDELEQLEPKP